MASGLESSGSDNLSHLEFISLDDQPDAEYLALGAASDVWSSPEMQQSSAHATSEKAVHKVLRVGYASLQSGTADIQLRQNVWRDFLRDYRSRVKQWQLLQHENVVRVLGFGRGLNLKVELCATGCVRDYLKIKPILNPSKTGIILDLLKGVVYLHEHTPPIVHGNLNAGKIFISEGGTTKIGEFGLAALCYPFSALVSSISFTGLSRWLSPELVDREAGTPIVPTISSDIWALGCVLFEIIAETLPYAKYKHDVRIQRSIIAGEPPGQTDQHFGQPSFEALPPLLMHCWQQDPKKRPSASNILDQAVVVLSDKARLASPPGSRAAPSPGVFPSNPQFFPSSQTSAGGMPGSLSTRTQNKEPKPAVYPRNLAATQASLVAPPVDPGAPNNYVPFPIFPGAWIYDVPEPPRRLDGLLESGERPGVYQEGDSTPPASVLSPSSFTSGSEVATEHRRSTIWGSVLKWFQSTNKPQRKDLSVPGPTVDVLDQVPQGAIIVQSSLASPLHALIIGIDNYLHQPDLACAVHDADKIFKFLVNDLGTPPSHITNLRNTAATRKGIIDAFLKLHNDTEIPYGSPILIYFAGHGGLLDPSAEQTEWHGSADKIQVIFPHDYGEPFIGKARNEETINCIPDWTIAALLNQLTEAKGDNVTVIFDSCHSASGSRELPTIGGRRARVAKVLFGIPADIDNDVLACTSEPGTIPLYMDSPFSAHQRSHIHLAACGSNEHAWEENGHGEFTEAFLKTIRAYGTDKVTYRNFVRGLPHLAKQTPHCYGVHQDRCFFDGQVPSRKVVYVPVTYDPTKKNLTLQAGVASGVTDGSVWELRQYAILGDEGIIGTITARSPEISTTKMEVENAGDPEFWGLCESGTSYERGLLKLYARLVKSGPGNELKVWFSPEAKRLIFPELEDGNPQVSNEVSREFGYVAHAAQDSADMLVRIYEPKGTSPGQALTPLDGPRAEPEVEFVLCNCYITTYGVSTLPQRKPARRSEVETVLFAAARWHWYLRYTNDEHSRSLVAMDMFKIAERKQVNGRYSDTHWRQLRGDKRGSDMNQTGVVDFEVRGEDLYGIRLKSEVAKPLYVRMFYFDMSTFCINDQFGHAYANGRAGPYLGSRGEFIIGDDLEGGTPLPFELDPGDMVDVGCMKVFWSTDPLDLDHLGQESAFEIKPGRQGRMVGLLRPKIRLSDWGTTSMILVQRKPCDSV